ncbi:MAG: hypothetical protein Q8P01_01390 [bacterium]|nr:hypothetical protein [bacterium]
MTKENPKREVARETTDERAEREDMEARGFEYIGAADDFKMPEWMECVWRRVPCGELDCKICGRIQRDRMRHAMKGEDPDDMKNVFEDVGRNLQEAMTMIRKDAEARGIDITNLDDVEIEEEPKPEDFPLYDRVMAWQKSASEMIQEADEREELWLLTEAAADLLWYKNTLCVKTFRQLTNRWHMDRGDEYEVFDHNYTGYVLTMCLNLLKKSLRDLKKSVSSQADTFDILLKNLKALEKEIVRI